MSKKMQQLQRLQALPGSGGRGQQNALSPPASHQPSFPVY
jgi:hypothetical protein